jgi:Fes/CIP4, and EFC/F-BAR homology domain
MRTGGRSLEELRSFYRERASIEEDYARKLSKLSRQSIGRDEIG